MLAHSEVRAAFPFYIKARLHYASVLLTTLFQSFRQQIKPPTKTKLKVFLKKKVVLGIQWTSLCHRESNMLSEVSKTGHSLRRLNSHSPPTFTDSRRVSEQSRLEQRVNIVRSITQTSQLAQLKLSASLSLQTWNRKWLYISVSTATAFHPHPSTLWGGPNA